MAFHHRAAVRRLDWPRVVRINLGKRGDPFLRQFLRRLTNKPSHFFAARGYRQRSGKVVMQVVFI